MKHYDGCFLTSEATYVCSICCSCSWLVRIRVLHAVTNIGKKINGKLFLSEVAQGEKVQ